MSRRKGLTDAELKRRRAADPRAGTPPLIRLYQDYGAACRECGLQPQPWSVYMEMLHELYVPKMVDGELFYDVGIDE